MRWRTAMLAAALTASWAASIAARAENPLGLYFGAAAGDAHVRADPLLAETSYDVTRSATGWKAMVGLRPVSILGAEFEYVDFGRPDYRQSGGVPSSTTLGSIHSRAEALYAMAYLPIPLPFLDVYAKAGAARLQTSARGEVSGVFCPISRIAPGCPSFSTDRSGTDFAFGAGLQVKFSALAVRAEYERIDASFGEPDLLSLGLTWTF